MLSVCIITKNQEENLERCLSALSGYGFELVVVDTGSTDRTVEVAKRYTDRLFSFDWQDDFAAAKNYAISKAKHDLVLVVDSDEFLEPLSKENLVKLASMAAQNPDAVGRVRRRNVVTKDDARQENREWINRIFDRRKYHYKGRIHEQVVPYAGGEYQTWLSPLTFVHTGYDLTAEEREKKTRRNITMLERELSELTVDMENLRRKNDGSAELEEMEKQIPYLLYQLGKSWYMARDFEQACGYFSDGLSCDLNPRLEYVADMVETYGYALMNSGQEQAALSFENIYDVFGESADFQFLMGLIYMKNARFDEAVREFEKASRQPDSRSVGVNSFAAHYNIGVIYECLGKLDKAREYYVKCGEYEPASVRLKEISDSGSTF